MRSASRPLSVPVAYHGSSSSISCRVSCLLIAVMATSFYFFGVEQLRRPLPSRIVIAPRPRTFANKPNCKVLCPICHIVRSQWGEPLPAARPHDFGGCCLTPERTSVWFGLFPRDQCSKHAPNRSESA